METYNVLCTTNTVLQDELKIRERFKKMSCYYLCYYSLRRCTTTYIFRFIRELSKFVNYIKKNEIKRIKKNIVSSLYILSISCYPSCFRNIKICFEYKLNKYMFIICI